MTRSTLHDTAIPTITSQASGTPGLIFRGLRAPQDFAGLASVYNRCMAADGIERAVTAHELAVFYEHIENCDPAHDVLVVEAPDGLIGYLRTQWREEPLSSMRVYMHTAVLAPEWRRKGIGSVLLARAEARLQRVAAGHPPEIAKVLQAYVADKQTEAGALLARHAYQAARYSYLMIRPTLDDVPELPLPDGLEIRPALPEHYRRIWEADDEAFRDHWGYMPMGEEDYLRWLNESTFDPSLWRLAWDGDQVAGMVLAFVNATENAEYNRRRGYTEDICVRRPWRRRGLARALIARSLRGLRARGMTEAALGVDTENISGALRLYESLGYRPVQRWALLRKPLDQAAGRGLSREAVESGAST